MQHGKRLPSLLMWGGGGAETYETCRALTKNLIIQI